MRKKAGKFERNSRKKIKFGGVIHNTIAAHTFENININTGTLKLTHTYKILNFVEIFDEAVVVIVYV